MSFTPQQDEALAAVKRWYETGTEQVFRLFGAAGTGKTTLAKFFADNVDGTTQYTAFTGKACQVLRNKDCGNAATIHSLIYKATRLPDGNVKFIKNNDSPLRYAKLIIADEVSMVDDELGKDLLSFGKKVLVLGDPFQLPPVKGSGFFTKESPDLLLTEVHRQAAESPILRLSMDVRNGKRLRPGDYGDLRITSDRIDADEAIAFDQIICGKNKSRDAYNSRVRELRGFSGKFPNKGERLICLKNNSTNGLFNGSMWNLTLSEKANVVLDGDGGIYPVTEGGQECLKFYLKSADDEGLAQSYVLPENFDGDLKDYHWSVKRRFDEFDYGYAITCHKAQGSQWDSVLLFDESYVFQSDQMRWLYTAITRAAKKLTIFLK